MSTSSQEVVRDWCIQRQLSEHPTYTLAATVEDVPADYGTYALYDGADIIAFGYVRNLKTRYQEHESRMRVMLIPIFLWEPDLDGSVRKRLDAPFEEDDEDDEVCDYCGERRRVQ